MELLEKVLDDKNLFEAYKQVYKNKGASGVDGVTVDELGYYMIKHKSEIKEQIRNRKYKPNKDLKELGNCYIIIAKNKGY